MKPHLHTGTAAGIKAPPAEGLKFGAVQRKIRAPEKLAAAFSDLGRVLSAARTHREAAQILMVTADELFGWDACTFDLFSADQESVRTVLYADTIAGKRVDVSSECVGTRPSASMNRVLDRGAQLILRPAGGSARAESTAFGDKARRSASLMFAPVRKDSEVIGVLSIQSYTPKAYTRDDLRVLQALADHCGGALERIRAEEAVERLNQELQQHFEEVSRLNLELERRVQRRTLQWEAVNKELEAFCYSVSHDLRAPLRIVRGFSEVLLERYAQKLEPQGQDLLRRSCEACKRMDELVEDLLNLSRIGRSHMQRQSVDLSGIAASIALELQKSEPGRGVEFVIAPSLRAEGDERLLRIALDNLLRNAWKFTNKLPQARIEFCATSDPEPAFMVRDNGVGFDGAYAGKLFGAFQRLHSASDFPGTGVGLATVQRIIVRHGGRVWAAGAVNHGAAFYFTLPEPGESCS